jgi:hypothetical protein
MFSESESFFSAISSELGIVIVLLEHKCSKEVMYLLLTCELVVVMVLASRFAWRTSLALARKDGRTHLPCCRCLFVPKARVWSIARCGYKFVKI